MTSKHTIVDVPNISVGHTTHIKQGTGCTIVLSNPPATIGIDISGGAPGTRETALCDPQCYIQEVNGVMLSGGSAFGLAASDGAMKYLSHKSIGIRTPKRTIPIIPSAVIYDLHKGNPEAAPTANDGYLAAKIATSEYVDEGSVGVGTGAMVGKINGPDMAMNGGVGTASIKLDNNVIVGALVVINSFGDIIDPYTGQILIGAKSKDGDFLNTEKHMLKGQTTNLDFFQNTTLAVVATNANLNKAEATRVSAIAQNGIARSVVPCKTMLDGDVVFTLSNGSKKVDVNILGNAAAYVVSQAIIRAARISNNNNV